MRNKRVFATRVVTDPLEAIRRSVYGRGALEACADECGISHQLLSKQLNLEPGAGELWLSRAMRIESLLDTDALAECAAARRDGLFVKLPDVMLADAELIQGYSRLLTNFAEASRSFSAALADGKLTEAEVDDFQKHLRDVYTAGEQLVRAARSRVEPG